VDTLPMYAASVPATIGHADMSTCRAVGNGEQGAAEVFVRR
jgi:hypothetical protein